MISKRRIDQIVMSRVTTLTVGAMCGHVTALKVSKAPTPSIRVAS